MTFATIFYVLICLADQKMKTTNFDTVEKEKLEEPEDIEQIRAVEKTT